jgi:hypothetical protein
VCIKWIGHIYDIYNPKGPQEETFFIIKIKNKEKKKRIIKADLPFINKNVNHVHEEGPGICFHPFIMQVKAAYLMAIWVAFVTCF